MTQKPITKVAEGVFAVAVLLSHGAPAVDPAVDKSQYTIFNPTPPSLMRDFEPDRPDLTDSAFTVDAGHISGPLDH